MALWLVPLMFLTALLYGALNLRIALLEVQLDREASYQQTLVAAAADGSFLGGSLGSSEARSPTRRASVRGFGDGSSGRRTSRFGALASERPTQELQMSQLTAAVENRRGDMTQLSSFADEE